MKPLFFVLAIGLFSSAAYAQEKDSVLHKGNPPLTKSLVTKSLGFMEWLLDAKISQEHAVVLRKYLVTAWEDESDDDIQATVGMAGMYDHMLSLSEKGREQLKKENLQPVLNNIRADLKDPIAKIFDSAYKAARKADNKKDQNQISSTITPARPITDMMISIIVHDRNVCFRERLKNSLNIQKPESLI